MHTTKKEIAELSGDSFRKTLPKLSKTEQGKHSELDEQAKRLGDSSRLAGVPTEEATKTLEEAFKQMRKKAVRYGGLYVRF